MAGCIEDGFSTSPSDQPVFSVDTLDLGYVFTAEPTPTSRFLVHNPHGKSLSISDISISGADAACFRMNVDGISGTRFSGVDIRSKDSIFVLIEATFPETDDVSRSYTASLDFTTNGVTSSVQLAATGLNAIRITGQTLTADTRFSSEKPYIIYDSLRVAEGATLTLDAGTRLCFHDKAMMIVRGTLITEGTPEKPVELSGDRTGDVISGITFDIMSRQWTGVFFTATSTGNSLSHTVIRNTEQGVAVTGDPETDYTATPQLALLNCRLRNSGDLVLEAYHSAVKAVGCEFSEGSNGLVYLHGGAHNFNHCTFANNYLFTVIGGPAIQMAHLSPEPSGLDDLSGLPYLRAEFTNSIIYGLGTDLSHGDLTGTEVVFNRCLLKSEGTDDANFLSCLWGEDPLYYTIRDEYVFDYRLKEESPAIGAGYQALTLPEAATDAYGLSRGPVPDLGAYVYSAP